MTANEITSGLLLEIPKRFHARAWRRNVGAGSVGGRFVRFSHPGESDIQGIIEGRFLAVEVKAGRDKLTAQQESFLFMIEKYGGIALVARDVESTLTAIENELQFKTALLATVGG